VFHQRPLDFTFEPLRNTFCFSVTPEEEMFKKSLQTGPTLVGPPSGVRGSSALMGQDLLLGAAFA